MVIVQVDDLLHEKQRVESADIRIVFEATLQKEEVRFIFILKTCSEQ